jgi:hypothetical protein
MQASEINSPFPASVARDTDFDALPGPVLFLLLGAAVLGLGTANPLLTVGAILVLPLFIALLRRPGEPPVLLFAVGFQWLQVTAKVFHANVLGIPVAQLAESPSIESAIWLGLGALVVLSVGIWLVLTRLRDVDPSQAERESLVVSVERSFVLYLILTILATSLRGMVWSLGGFAQAGFALISLRWVAFFLLGYVVLKQRRGYLYLLTALTIEFIGGIGFFSGFKLVIFFSLILFGTVYTRLNARMVMYSSVAIVALAVFASAWTVIKPEFREYLNQGSGSQSVQVSNDAKLAKLVSLTSELTWADIGTGMEPLFRRIAYVDYLALTMDYVPAVVPHERGEVWKTAIGHVLQPRFLFPDKPRLLSDSEHTMQYTGLRLASDAQGTSISIGYVGDAYIDFGKTGALFVVFVLGMLWGVVYLYFIRKSRVKLLGFAMVVTVLLGAYQFEMVATKLFGGILLKFLVFALLMRFVERPLWSWLHVENRQRAPAFQRQRPDPGPDRLAGTSA